MDITRDMSKQEYAALIKQREKPSPIVKDCTLAFLIGGAICVLGQLIREGWLSLGLSDQDAATATSASLILLSVLLTGLNVYNKIARFGGAGTWCLSPVLPTLWPPRPSTSAVRASSPVWPPGCLPWQGR